MSSFCLREPAPARCRSSLRRQIALSTFVGGLREQLRAREHRLCILGDYVLVCHVIMVWRLASICYVCLSFIHVMVCDHVCGHHLGHPQVNEQDPPRPACTAPSAIAE